MVWTQRKNSWKYNEVSEFSSKPGFRQFVSPRERGATPTAEHFRIAVLAGPIRLRGIAQRRPIPPSQVNRVPNRRRRHDTSWVCPVLLPTGQRVARHYDNAVKSDSQSASGRQPLRYLPASSSNCSASSSGIGRVSSHGFRISNCAFKSLIPCLQHVLPTVQVDEAFPIQYGGSTNDAAAQRSGFHLPTDGS